MELEHLRYSTGLYEPDMTFSDALRRWMYLTLIGYEHGRAELDGEDAYWNELRRLEELLDSKTAGGGESNRWAVKMSGGVVK